MNKLGTGKEGSQAAAGSGAQSGSQPGAQPAAADATSGTQGNQTSTATSGAGEAGAGGEGVKTSQVVTTTGPERAAEGNAAPPASVPPSGVAAEPEASKTEGSKPDPNPDLAKRLAELEAKQVEQDKHLERLRAVAMEAALDRLGVLPEARDLVPSFDLSTPEGKAGLEEFVTKRPFLRKADDAPAEQAGNRRLASAASDAQKGWMGPAVSRMQERHQEKLAALRGGGAG